MFWLKCGADVAIFLFLTWMTPHQQFGNTLGFFFCLLFIYVGVPGHYGVESFSSVKLENSYVD